MSDRPPELLTAAAGQVAVVPVLAGRFEFALEVRRAFALHGPTHLVLDLPPSLAGALRTAVARLPMLSVLRLQGRDAPAAAPAAGYLLVEPTDGFVEALRLAAEQELPVVFAGREKEDGSGALPWPDPHILERASLEAWTGVAFAAAAAAEAATPGPEAGTAPDLRLQGLRARLLAHHTTLLLQDPAHRPLVVAAPDALPQALVRLGAESAVPFAPPSRLRGVVYHLHPDAAREVLTELPYLNAAWEEWRRSEIPLVAPRAWPLRRQDMLANLVQKARGAHRDDDGRDLAPQDVAGMFRFARNLSLLEGALVPDFYTLVIAARGVGGDDFAWHFWEQGASYPWQEATDGRPALRITLEDLDRSGRRVQFARTLKRRRRVMRLVQPRRRASRPGEWERQWSGQWLCSHPPEDIVIEEFGRFLARRTRGMLAAAQVRNEPFTTSMMDGLDMRETIRNRLHDGRLYVRHETPVKGQVGSVVVAFDPDDPEGRFPYRMTWQGEHQQESDMALYSTEPGRRMAGPGVSHCEYGGFLMTWPPGRMYFIWEDPEFAAARSPAERLLLAGIDYSEERLVAYVAPRPPRSFIHSFAGRRGRKVVYVPLGALAPATLDRMRTFHVLDGREVRAWAADYIRPTARR